MAAGKAGELLTAPLHGYFYEQNYNGNVWIASLTTAAAVPLAGTNASPTFLIWNPAGSNVNVIPISLHVGFHAGTGIAGAIGYSYVPNAGTGIGTGLAFSALTSGTIRTGQAGVGYGGATLFGTAATATGTAPYVPVRWKWSSFSQGAPITSTAAVYNLQENFEGKLILPPNNAFYIDASVAIAETFMISLVAYEAPV